MTATPTRSPWDFSDAFQLLHTPTEEKRTALKFSPSRNATILKRSSKLGDFSSVWQDLGTSPDTFNPTTEAVDFADFVAPSSSATIKQHVRTIPDPSLPPAAPLRDDIYASDGGYQQSMRKTVTWKDQSDPVEATTDAPTSEDEPASGQLTLFKHEDAGEVSEATLTKAQRKRDKKQRQKEKKRMQEETETPRRRKVFSDVESESEIKKLPRLTPASKASKHLIPPSPAVPSISVVPELKREAAPIGQTPVVVDTSDGDTAYKPKKNKSHKRGGSDSSTSTPSKPPQFTRSSVTSNLRPTSVPQVAKLTPAQETSHAQQLQFTNSFAHVPITTTPNKSSPKQVSLFFPPQSPDVGTTSTRMPAWYKPFNKSQSRPSLATPYASFPNPKNSIAHSSAPHAPAHHSSLDTVHICNNVLISEYSKFQILEKEERDLQLFLRLIHEFPADKKWLTKPVPMANHNESPKGIHIFVDFSNIWIGFMDHLKALQLRMRTRIPHQNMSFDALVLLLERKRPVAKRVLAGSYPLMPAMELAKQIGYETLILEKVYKARELNERQRRMFAMQSRNTFAPLGLQGSSPPGPPINPFIPTPPNASTPANPFASSTQTPLPPMAGPEKWVEQGVDEILHLKILESIVDSEEPSTMVVATGDAAKAEYSEGFMVMIRRALRKGWMVELVAFSKSISGEYWKRSFQEEWEGRFRILALDEWAQFLLDT